MTERSGTSSLKKDLDEKRKAVVESSLSSCLIAHRRFGRTVAALRTGPGKAKGARDHEQDRADDYRPAGKKPIAGEKIEVTQE
jgi:hypothetical protein